MPALIPHAFQPFTLVPEVCSAELPLSGDTCGGAEEQHAGHRPLTPTQLAALTELHRVGHLWPQGRGRNRVHDTGHRNVSRRTVDALVASGVARWADHTPGVMPHVVPVLRAWADATGTWHAEVPGALFSGLKGRARRTARLQVARAVITGEIWARSRQSYIEGWRPRVEQYGAAVGASSVAYYREA